MLISRRGAKLSIALAFAFFYLMHGPVAQCQEPETSDLTPREFSVEEALQNIARLQSNQYRTSLVAPILKIQLDVLNSELNLNRCIEEHRRDRSEAMLEESRMSEDHAQLTLTEWEGATGVLVDRETTNLLMRNCLVELQRVEWELAAEHGRPEPNPQNAELEIAKLDIEARKVELEAIAAKLESIGELTQNHPVSTKDLVIEQKTKLKLAETELAKAELRMKALADSASHEAAAKVMQLSERKRVLAEQLEVLKKQREVWKKVEPMHMRAATARRHAEALAEISSRDEIEHERRRLTVQLIEDALRSVEPKDSEAKTDTGK